MTLADVWGREGSHEAEDVEWITYAGREQMIALTKDERIRYNKRERDAIVRSACRVLCYPNANLPTREYIERITSQRAHVDALWDEPGMSTQITVRIPDDLARFVDEIAQAEHASGRAAIVTRALARERRRLAAERDAAIYAGQADDADSNAIAEYAAKHPLDLD